MTFNRSRRSVLSLFWCAVLLSVFFASCGSSATITATPNPVPPGPGFGSTTVKWTTGDGSQGQVYVVLNAEAPKLFGSGASGSQEAPWIGVGSVYEFRLVDARGQVLAGVKVERSRQ